MKIVPTPGLLGVAGQLLVLAALGVGLDDDWTEEAAAANHGGLEEANEHQAVAPANPLLQRC